MQKNKMTFKCLFLAALLCPFSSFAQQLPATADIREFASSARWLTTKVYIEGAPPNGRERQLSRRGGNINVGPGTKSLRVFLH